MKCKICGHRTSSLPAMSAHYRKKHPSKMRHGRTHKRVKGQGNLETRVGILEHAILGR